MHESTLKRLRALPVVLALLVTAVVWWNLQASHNQTVLVFSTGSEVGLYHRMASQIKAVVEASHPDIRIRLLASAGSNENITRLNGGEAQLALVQNDATGGQSVRSVAALYPEVLHLLCRSSANIRSLDDLSGHRVGVGAVGSGTEQFATRLLTFTGVELDQHQRWHGSFGDAVRGLQSGEIDAAFFLTGLGADVIRLAMRDEGLTLAAIQMHADDAAQPEDIARAFSAGFRVHHPYTSPQTIPLMAYEGRPLAPVPSMSIQAVLACHENVDAEIIGRIARTLFEQRAVLSQQESAFTHLDEQSAQSGLQFPLHMGAEHFFRRREPGFLNQHAEPMGFVVTLLLLTWSVLVWARRWYVQARKNRVDKHYKAIGTVIERLDSVTDVGELGELESELNHISRQAASELVQEQLAADESYIIYQNMLDGCRATLVRTRAQLQASAG